MPVPEPEFRPRAEPELEWLCLGVLSIGGLLSKRQVGKALQIFGTAGEILPIARQWVKPGKVSTVSWTAGAMPAFACYVEGAE